MRRTLTLIVLWAAASITAAACTAPPTPAVPIRLLDRWQPYSDTLTTGDTVRGWRFQGQAGDLIRLRLDTKADQSVTLALQDDAGNTLTTEHDGDLLVKLPADGVYTALVQLAGGERSDYTLTLTYPDRDLPTATPTATHTPRPTRTPTATYTPSNTPTITDTPSPTATPTPIYAPLGTLSGRLQVGAAIAGSFLSEFERHIYLFTGARDQQVTITLTGTSGSVDPVLTLFDPTGQPIATGEDSGDSLALLRDIRLPVDGEYIVQALGGGTGSYHISLQANAPVLEIASATPAGELPPG